MYKRQEQEQLLHAVDEAWNQGIMVVTAAGNNGPKENSVDVYKRQIFTFDIPPKKNVEHIEAKVLTTNEEKMHIFEGIGICLLYTSRCV